MNSKQLKFYQLFEQMLKKPDITTNAFELSNSFRELIDLDYFLAQNIWEYLAIVNEPIMNNQKQVGLNIGQVVCELFYAKAQTKCVKTIYDITAIRRAVYIYNPACFEGIACNILVDALAMGKLENAEEILKCLVKNNEINFGSTLKLVLERLFIEILKKNPSKKIELNKKLTTLLLTYISKVKTDDRPLLEQRIKETQ